MVGQSLLSVGGLCSAVDWSGVDNGALIDDDLRILRKPIN